MFRGFSSCLLRCTGIAGILLVSGLAAQDMLLLRLAGGPEKLELMVVLSVQLLVIISSARLSRWRRMPETLVMIQAGFLICAAGLLLLVVLLHNLRDGWWLLTGVGLGGVGQGMIYAALRPNGKTVKKPVIRLVFSVAITMILALHIQSMFAGNAGFPYAFAVLADLALLGALKAYMTRREPMAYAHD